MSSWLMSAPSSNGSGSPQMKVWRRLGHLGPRGGVGVEAVPVREREQPRVQAGAEGAHVALQVVAGRVEAPAAHRLFGPADELRFDEGALEAAPEAAAAERQG